MNAMPIKPMMSIAKNLLAEADSEIESLEKEYQEEITHLHSLINNLSTVS